ncbi:MAG: hypothetical protein CM15mP87_10540 [Candidatus Neomarinimicrobiota bacterium]|nr:MAG: hypothetical protein CM15mP87_10540 [Candidatus Neomarinimicrobiota bacterium]
MRTLPNGNCYPGFLQVGRPVTFKVQRQVSLTGNDDIDWEQIPIGFIDVIPFGEPDSIFNADGTRESDWIVFMDHEDSLGNPMPSWRFLLNLMPNDDTRIYDQPRAGDTAHIVVDKPFLKEDVYEFTTYAPIINENKGYPRYGKNLKGPPNPLFCPQRLLKGQNTFNSGGASRNTI